MGTSQSSITNLNLSNSNLSEFPKVSKIIESLNLSNNELSTLASLRGIFIIWLIIVEYQMLFNLNLTGNKLDAIPLLPISISSLYASRNRLFLSSLTHLGDLERLVILDLSQNELE